MHPSALLSACIISSLILLATSSNANAVYGAKDGSAVGAAFLWSPLQSLAVSGDADGVSVARSVRYDVVSPLSLVQDVMAAAFSGTGEGKAGQQQQQQPDVIVAFLSREMASDDITHIVTSDVMTSERMVDPLRPVKEAMAMANSSLTAPFVAEAALDSPLVSLVVASFVEKTNGQGTVAVSSSCAVRELGAASVFTSTEEMRAYLREKASSQEAAEKSLIVVCSPVAQESDHMMQLAEEGAVLDDVLASVRVFSPRFLGLYMSDLAANQDAAAQRRVLASTVCGTKCHLKATLLETLFVAIVLLITLVSGLCCLSGVDTPTRFEVPSES
eukprot:TRINITY_DN4358_c0_g1_i2.p1 TRINITY_DN4358_c0_g1~~TRINITY_DN4358_c0_g1_i2.p1  ORF type:complete len:330 (-),score=83.49 TRINITY_DN4358_c0_g1_i2:804-1793(-)